MSEPASNPSPRIGLVAPCSIVGQVELKLGVEFMRQAGLDVIVHPQCAAHHYTFAGTDQQRAGAFWDYANDPSIDVVWSARGGYGATRILPLLRQLATEKGKPPHKLLVGYSDVTALHEFVRQEWGWSTLHATMPAADLSALAPEQWEATLALVRGESPKLTWAGLRWLTEPPTKPIRAALVGGNLSLWAAMAGTDVQPSGRRRILFLEDVGEPPYRIDRMMVQVEQSGMLTGCSAIVLGDFTNCEDEKNTKLAEPASEAEWSKLRADRASAPRIPQRPLIDLDGALNESFAQLGRRLGIPVAVGLPVGHGPHFWPLPLGARYTLKPEGTLSLWKWER